MKNIYKNKNKKEKKRKKKDKHHLEHSQPKWVVFSILQL
jgi:hypothetical protein